MRQWHLLTPHAYRERSCASTQVKSTRTMPTNTAGHCRILVTMWGALGEANKTTHSQILCTNSRKLDSKRLSATARTLSVRVLELETPSDEGITKVQLKAEQVKYALRVDDALETVVFFHHVIFCYILLWTHMTSWTNTLQRLHRVKPIVHTMQTFLISPL